MELFKALSPVIQVFMLIVCGFVFAQWKRINLTSLTEIIVYLGSHRWCLARSQVNRFSSEISRFYSVSRAFVANCGDARTGDDSDHADSLGYRLHDVESLQWGHALGGALLRIFGGFAAANIAVNLIGAVGVNRQVLLLYGALPAAVVTFVLAEKYRQDPGLAASIVVISTLTSILTIPIVFWLIL
jgi:predicted permease